MMLTALGDFSDRVAVIEAGADDYLVKPTAAAEIDARVKAIARRAGRGSESSIMRAGDIEVNEIKDRAIRGGRVLTRQSSNSTCSAN